MTGQISSTLADAFSCNQPLAVQLSLDIVFFFVPSLARSSIRPKVTFFPRCTCSKADLTGSARVASAGQDLESGWAGAMLCWSRANDKGGQRTDGEMDNDERTWVGNVEAVKGCRRGAEQTRTAGRCTLARTESATEPSPSSDGRFGCWSRRKARVGLSSRDAQGSRSQLLFVLQVGPQPSWKAGAMDDRYRQPIWSADGMWSFVLPWITP